MFCGQDMVLLHHEVEVDFPDGRKAEHHQATLLEYGRTKNGKTTTAMAFTVGIPAAIGAVVSSHPFLLSLFFSSFPLSSEPGLHHQWSYNYVT